eukprot:gene19145-25756_t
MSSVPGILAPRHRGPGPVRNDLDMYPPINNASTVFTRGSPEVPSEVRVSDEMSALEAAQVQRAMRETAEDAARLLSGPPDLVVMEVAGAGRPLTGTEASSSTSGPTLLQGVTDFGAQQLWNTSDLICLESDDCSTHRGGNAHPQVSRPLNSIPEESPNSSADPLAELWLFTSDTLRSTPAPKPASIEVATSPFSPFAADPAAFGLIFGSFSIKDQANVSTSSLNASATAEAIRSTSRLARSPSPNLVIDHKRLEYAEVIGSGFFGKVYRGKWKGTEVAIKKLNENSCSELDDFW